MIARSRASGPIVRYQAYTPGLTKTTGRYVREALSVTARQNKKKLPHKLSQVFRCWLRAQLHLSGLSVYDRWGECAATAARLTAARRPWRRLPSQAPQSEAAQSGAAQCAAVQSWAAQSWAVQREAVQNEEGRSGAAQTEAVQSEGARSKVVQGEAPQSGPALRGIRLASTSPL